MSGQGGSTRHRIVQTESFRCIHNERNELSVSSSSMINSYLMALSSKVVRQTKAIWFSRVVVVVVGWCARQSHYRPAQTIRRWKLHWLKGKKVALQVSGVISVTSCLKLVQLLEENLVYVSRKLSMQLKNVEKKKMLNKSQFKTCWDDPGSLISLTSSNNRWPFVCVWKLISLIINYSFTN